MTPNTDNPSAPPSPETPVNKEKWWKILIPTKEFLFTPLLIDINIVLFLLMVITSGKAMSIISPEIDVLVKWGINVKYLTIGQHEWWRLFTCIFAHYGIIHLALNMYALLYIGIYLEPLLGKARYIASYLAAGTIASLASVWWHDNTASAGASGAIFGMYGVFLALLTTNLIEKSIRKPLLSSIGVFILYNLAFGSAVRGIDNAAHIGGLLSGIVIGYINYLSFKIPALKNNLVTAVLLILLGIGAAYVTLPRLTDPVGNYMEVMKSFGKYEAIALKVYNLPKNTTDDEYLRRLQDESLPNWIKSKKEVAKLDGFNLPPELQQSTKMIGQYIDLRTRVVQLQIARLKEKTNQYDAELDQLNKKIEDLISKSGGSSK